METESLSVLHLDNVKEWRGGQQQTFYLLEAMVREGYHTALACQPNSEYHNKLRDSDYPHITIKMRGEFDFYAGRTLAQKCAENKFRIIHAHSANALTIALWAKMFKRNLIIVAARRVDFTIKKNIFSIYKYNNTWVNRIICISDYIKKVMLNDGLPEEKLITIHSGIDIGKFGAIKKNNGFKSEWGIPENHLIIGTVAAIVGHKDYPTLLEAAKTVLEKCNNVTFMALGQGKDQDKVFALAQELGLKQGFIFCGYQKEVGQFLKQFDIFVLASKRKVWGLLFWMPSRLVFLWLVPIAAVFLKQSIRMVTDCWFTPRIQKDWLMR